MPRQGVWQLLQPLLPRLVGEPPKRGRGRGRLPQSGGREQQMRGECGGWRGHGEAVVEVEVEEARAAHRGGEGIQEAAVVDGLVVQEEQQTSVPYPLVPYRLL